MEHLIFEIGIVVIFSSVAALILYYLKQPLILAYILAGILLGPFGFNVIKDIEFIHGISNVGIMLMLFLVGLEMNTSRLKDLGMVSLVAGIGQVIFTCFIGFWIVKIFGFTIIQSVYLAVALTFSSTVIAVKIMSDKHDTKSFYGQICIGILIVQDILAIIALLILAGFKGGSFVFDYGHFGVIFLKGIVLTILTMLISKKILKYIYSRIATSHELLILFSLGWCFVVSLLSIEIGFSMEIGAFIAGISLSNLPYTFEINSKAKVLRDFFITIFFAALGAGMVFSSISSFIVPAIVLSLFVLIGNPIIVLILMGAMGYDKRVSFLTGLTIANISEFSLIVIALGSKLGHLNDTITSMVAIIAITTMVISSYMITYNNQLYKLLSKYLSIFEFRKKKKDSKNIKNFSDHIILLGCGHMGEQILEQILSFKEEYIVVDHDNQVIKNLMAKKINCVYGDIADEDVLDNLDMEDAEVIISTLPHIEDNYFLLRSLEKISKEKKPIVIAVTNSAREGLEIFNKGIDYVILKPYLGAQHIHNINKELYKIEKELQHVEISKDKRNINLYDSSEHEVARLVHNLNALRLNEIKEKISKNKINLKTKIKNNNNTS